MESMKFTRPGKLVVKLNGYVGDYVSGVIDNWLLVAPKANPAMIEMFADRDVPPFREMMPWAGEFAGKYLTGAVEVLRLTGDARLRSALREFVAALVSLQAEDGYLGPWPSDCHITNHTSTPGYEKDKWSGGPLTWDTWGHYHAMLGLMLWHEETGDKSALDCVVKMADLMCEKYLGKKDTRLVDTGSTEMNLAPIHSLAILYRKLGTQRYLDLALQIADEFAAEGPDGPLAGDYIRQALDGKEFYETPKPRWESLHPIMGIAELYRITGDDRYKEAFERIWRSIVRFDRHNNGGFSSGEAAMGSPYALAGIETCCTIAWIAMSIEMLKLTGESSVADELELSTLNQVLGMHSATGRWATYNTPMNGVRSSSDRSLNFQSREGASELNCCSVNSARGFGMISEWALMTDSDGLVLNWYGPSTMTTAVGDGVALSLVQETTYPRDGEVAISVNPSKPVEFRLKLRIPKWSSNTRIEVNGVEVGDAEPGTYLAIEREWRSGDKVLVHFDMSFHFWKGEKECEGRSSVYRGPLLLAFDKRYNPHIFSKLPATVLNLIGIRPDFEDLICQAPALCEAHLKAAPIEWNGWVPPAVLVEFESEDGEKVRMCDYGSAGETGTPYVTWIPVKHKESGPLEFIPVR